MFPAPPPPPPPPRLIPTPSLEGVYCFVDNLTRRNWKLEDFLFVKQKNGSRPEKKYNFYITSH